MNTIKTALKTVAADKLFWLGLILGFICGTLHNWYHL